MELKQFDFNLDRFHYVVEDSGVHLMKKRLSSSSDTFVKFEDIGSKVIRENSRKLLWLGLSILFLIIAIAVFISRMRGNKVGGGAELFHLGVSFTFLVIYLLTRKNVVFLAQADNTNALEFIATRRYKEKVDIFIKDLLESRNKYLLDKYSHVDEFLPYTQQYNNLVWLYNLDLLSKEQLKQKISELDKLGEDTGEEKPGFTKIIGFKRYDEDEEGEEEEE